MNAQCFHRAVALAVLAGLASSCGRQVDSDIPTSGPAYILTTEGKGAADDVHDVLLQVLQRRMKPVRVAGPDAGVVQLGTIHVDMRLRERTYESSDRKEKVGLPRHLRATVDVTTFDGRCNWDGEHSIGFETDELPGSFSDSDKMRRRYARRLFEVAVKQLPDRGVFEYISSSPAQPSK